MKSIGALILFSVLHTKLVTKDLKKDTDQWRMMQDHADEQSVPMKNESCVIEDYSICVPERRRDQIGVSWQRCDAFLRLDHSVKWTTIGSCDIHSVRLVAIISEILSFLSNKSNVVNSLEKTERRIKEFERDTRTSTLRFFDKFNEVNAFEMDGENPTQK